MSRTKQAVRVTVDRWQEIPIRPEPAASRFDFQHRWQKLAFFCWREGLKLTWNKVKSSRLQQRLQQQCRLLCVEGRDADNGQTLLAVGVQTGLDSEMTFDRRACFFSSDAQARQEHAGYWLRRLNDDRELAQALFQHSPYAGRVCPIDLAQTAAHTTPQTAPRWQAAPVAPKPPPSLPDQGLVLLGAGAYTHAYVLPALKTLSRALVVDLNPALAQTTAQRFGFTHYLTHTDPALEQIARMQQPQVVIASYHDSHTPLAQQVLEANPKARLMVEKPPITNQQQLDQLLALRQIHPHIEIGFNRRYAPMVRHLQQLLAGRKAPLTMVCSIKELGIPDSHWYHWPSQGTRITGNLCHWIDLGVHCIQSPPVDMTLAAAPNSRPGDELTLSIAFADGSRLILIASDHGHALRGVQEWIELRWADNTVRIDDFMRLQYGHAGRVQTRHKRLRDKGHQAMYHHWLQRMAADQPAAYPQQDLRWTGSLMLQACALARATTTTVASS